MVKCISCNEETQNGTEVPCPNCKTKLFRCQKCRQLSIDYKCKCGYIGP